MREIEKAVKWALDVAADPSHGYDQTRRWGPDYDCSSLVISAYEQAGVPVKKSGATYTGNMRKVFTETGFENVSRSINFATGEGLKRGDVLLNDINHTAMCIGGGQLVQAGSNEWGGITGGATGDQTGGEISVMGYYNFPWDCVLRYKGADVPEPGETGEYTVEYGDSLWSIADKFLGDGSRYGEIMTLNGLKDDVIRVGQPLKIPSKRENSEPARPSSALVRLPVISYGDVGKAVQSLQRLLEGIGYDLPECGSDGDFGYETRAALEAFQKEFNLPAGDCDGPTWAALIGC